MLIEESPNRYSVMIILIQTMGPIMATVVTYLLTRSKVDKAKNDVAQTVSTVATEVHQGNQIKKEIKAQVEEVSKTVNGRTDTLLAEKQALADQLAETKIELAKAQTIIAQRRSTD